MQRLLLLCLLSLSGCAEVVHAWEGFSAPRYPLDDVSRWVESAALSCADDSSQLVTYRGDHLRYERPIRVHPAFRDRLTIFETIVDEVAREHFGRPPRRIKHFGAYACRTVRGRPSLLSEHALGNALDVAGFDFGPMPRKSAAFASTPKPLRRAFQIRLDKHWAERAGVTSPYSAFLRELAARIVARPDVFRVVLGPGWPGHHNHFHLDNAPYRLVGIERT
jgi:hypothetical protein